MATSNRDSLNPGVPHKVLAMELLLRNLFTQLEKLNPELVASIAAAVNDDFSKISIDDPDEAEFIENMKSAAAIMLTRDLI